jgi:hypothetical protein
MRSIHRLFLPLVVFLTFACGSARKTETTSDPRIRPFSENPFYWQYQGEPLMLIGASADDNLFQLADLETHLDQLHAAGANYIRNTMSERPVNGNEVRAFASREGRYDLSQWNEAYWDRFGNLLEWCRERDIIVQVEIWATHDLFGEEWQRSPWNPANNLNYSFNQTLLPQEAPERAYKMHPFFNSVPEALNDTVVLHYQKLYVDRLLTISLDYPNVLYCVTNEIQHAQSPAWSAYWAEFVRERALEKGVSAYVTEMFWAPDLKDDQHRHSLEHPETYDFFEASQNSARSGQENWDNLQYVRNRLKPEPRPINSVKIYGKTGEVTWPGSSEEAVDRFWRNILGGCASSRFHRDEKGKYGLGWSKLSINSVRAMRLVEEDLKPWEALPASELLIDREENEAYMMKGTDGTCVLYFPGEGKVGVPLSAEEREYKVRWIDVNGGEVFRDTLVNKRERMLLSPPSPHVKWVAVIRE